MSNPEDLRSITYCLWSAAAGVRLARTMKLEWLREATLRDAADWADRAYALHAEKYPVKAEVA